ncbi:MAG: glyoxalase [Alphaproteobacteria bacterium]|nr:glyoxalase [Alphaproteobacteria bacterium]|tara:strand:- start:2161 stop:2583 length:423 start_codon:yes stop_codon:yes gene_type:complete
MAITALNHVNIVTEDLEATRKFYADVIGLIDGDRPSFQFPGAWLYIDDEAVIHLVGVVDQPEGGTGTIDHVAFEAKGINDMIEILERREIPFHLRDVPGREIRQVFLHDPNGVKIELNFRGAEVVAARKADGELEAAFSS